MSGRKARFDDYEVDFVRRELRKCGIRIRLQRKPFRVLELLLRRPGELVTREELFGFLWPDSHVSFEHSLNTAVNSLRRVLGDSSRECHFIETRPGLGYRFSSPVEEMTDADSSPTPPGSLGKNRDAYEDYLKGRYFLDTMAEEEEIYKAIAFFNSAAIDETCCSLAHAGIAEAYGQLALFGSVCSSRVVSHARSSVESALRNDPDLPQAHVSAGRVKMIFDWDWKGTQESVDRARTLDANSVPAHTLQGSLLCTLGSYEEALQVCRHALALDPLSFPANLQFAACLYATRDFEGVIDQCWKMLTLRSGFAPAQILLALAYQQLGMYEEAVVEFQNAQRCTGLQAAATSGLGHVFAVAGLEDNAEQAFRELSTQAQSRYVPYYWYAVICAGRRQKDQALSFLEESFRQRDPALLSLKADARFDNMRTDDRFQVLLRRLDIQTSAPMRI
ncbi:MAG: winged helix-turn-helix domain-containing protein [Acidobacteriaceae bacterium]|nr:winged helix-turn-helix domain-containing protein [Acidobacteriaceae bacterium]MBV9497924.1 winged helix-turn-helix domain-containing protein [Acidobacteriaceae bacterium]